MAKRNNPEAKCQKMFFDWLVLVMPTERKLTFAVPNGGARDVREGLSLKRQGVTRGVFDIFMSIPRKGYHGLYIEFKTGRNKLTKEQKEFQLNARDVGYMAEVCYSFDEARELVESYFQERNE